VAAASVKELEYGPAPSETKLQVGVWTWLLICFEVAPEFGSRRQAKPSNRRGAGKNTAVESAYASPEDKIKNRTKHIKKNNAHKSSGTNKKSKEKLSPVNK